MSKKKRELITVSVIHRIEWIEEATLPLRCPGCDEPLRGFEGFEEHLLRVEYRDGKCLGSECLPEFQDEPGTFQSVECSCGHTLAEGAVHFVSTPKAIKQAEAARQVLKDMDMETG